MHTLTRARAHARTSGELYRFVLTVRSSVCIREAIACEKLVSSMYRCPLDDLVRDDHCWDDLNHIPNYIVIVIHNVGPT